MRLIEFPLRVFVYLTSQDSDSSVELNWISCSDFFSACNDFAQYFFAAAAAGNV